MRILRVIEPDGTQTDITCDKKEPPLDVIQSLVGGYVEHVPITYEGARRSAYVVDPFARHIPGERSREEILAPNDIASGIAGQRIRGRLIIDLGIHKERT